VAHLELVYSVKFVWRLCSRWIKRYCVYFLYDPTHANSWWKTISV